MFHRTMKVSVSFGSLHIAMAHQCFDRECVITLRMLASGPPVAIHSPAVAAFGSSSAVLAAFRSATHYGRN